MAWGWSPVGWKSLTMRNGRPTSVVVMWSLYAGVGVSDGNAHLCYRSHTRTVPPTKDAEETAR